MPTLRLNTESIRYLALFENLTGARVEDCIVDDDIVVFIVKSGDMGLAIGKGGMNIRNVRNLINKRIKVFEYSKDPKKFIVNMLYPIAPRDVNVINSKGKKIAIIRLWNSQERAMVIGKNGKNINLIKRILQRHHDIDEVLIR